MNELSIESFNEWLHSDEECLDSYEIIGFGDIEESLGDINRIVFRDCIFNPGLALSFSSVKKLLFINCIFKEPVTVQPGIIGEKCVFSNCQVPRLEIQNSSEGLIEIEGLESEFGVGLYSLSNDQVLLRDCAIKKGLTLDNKTSNKGLKLLVLDNCRIDQTLVTKYGSFVKDIRIVGGSFGKIAPYGGAQSLTLIGDPVMMVSELNLGAFNFDGSISLSHCDIESLNTSFLVSVSNTQIQIFGCKISKEWNLNNSVPHKMNVFTVDLSKCDLVIDNSDLRGCLFSNITWPRRHRLNSREQGSTLKAASLRESYRQFKQAMLKDGNHIDALAFYRNELEEYRALVKGNPEVKWEDKAILWMMRIFSDHGQSFLRPLTWLFGAHLVFFLIAIALNYNGFYFTSDHDWSVTFDYIGNYFHLLNPIHKLPVGQSGGMMIIDFLMRLSSSFFIYHIIRASRKFAKV